MIGLDKGSNSACEKKGLDWMYFQGRANRLVKGPRFFTGSTGMLYSPFTEVEKSKERSSLGTSGICLGAC